MEIIKKVTFVKVALQMFLLITVLHSYASSHLSIDPINFSIISNKSVLRPNEEFQISIKASYLALPANAVFVLEGAREFKLKLITPEGFKQTGGDFSDYVGTTLSSQNPSVEYTVKGYFDHGAVDGTFQLLRGGGDAENIKTFAQVGKLVFNLQEPLAEDTALDNARVLVSESGSIKYASLNAFYNGDVSDSDLIYITDSLKEGYFKYVPTSTLPDDGALVIEYNGKKYHRIYDGVVNVNWYGVVGDGSTDNTETIQYLFQDPKFTKLYFPRNTGSYRINSVKIYPNREIEFETGTVIEGLGQLGPYDPMIYLIGVYNIKLKGQDVTFKDHRENYTGQQRHIFLMKGVKDIYIEGISAINGGGDGFYIGTTSTIKYSENVKLVNVKAINNRRQGLTLISGKNIEIIDSEFSNSNGEGPQAGIDIETNEATDILEEIKLMNVRTYNNRGSGILIAPLTLPGTDRIVSILIRNHIDNGSIVGAQVASVRSTLAGDIIFDSPIWQNSAEAGFIARNWSYKGPKVQVVNPKVINPNTSGNTSINYGAAYLIYRAKNDVGNDNIGNIHLLNPSIQDYRSSQTVRSAYCYRDIAKSLNVLNCTLINPAKSNPTLNNNYVIAHNGEIVIEDSEGALVQDLGDYTRYINNWTYYSLFHNQSSKALRVLRLEKMVPNFPEVTVEVRNSLGIRIIPDATDNILPISTENGKYLTSTQIGSRIVLKKMTNDSWVVKEMTGTWIVQP